MFHLLLSVIYLAFISLGLPDALLGSAWPSMYPAFHVPVSYAGIISMIIAAGTVISSLQSDRLQSFLHHQDYCHQFCSPPLLFALFGFSVSHSLHRALSVGGSRVGRCKCRCSAQQLCCSSLRKPTYELAALYVGCRCFYRTLYYGIRLV